MSSELVEAQEEDRHGHDVTIVINGRRVEVHEKELTFEQVVELSGLPSGPDVVFTISYRKARGEEHEGSMVQGGKPVKIKHGTVFNVDPTNRS